MGTSTQFERLLAGLDPRRPTPLYEQIASRIRVAVATGELRPDEALPSVRQLAATLRINPSTVVGAYRDLESEGFVYTKRGSGTFVAQVSKEVRLDEERAQAQRLIDTLIEDAARMGVSMAAVEAALVARMQSPSSQGPSDRTNTAGAGTDG